MIKSEVKIMCDICRQTPCNSRCPNAPEPPVFGICVNCKEEILDGYDYYDIDGDIWCEECIDDSRKTAEVE